MRDDDISQLWADDNGAWEPAPLRRPVPPLEPARPSAIPHENGNGYAERLDALERKVRALVQAVGRVESLVNERLSHLEQQVAELSTADERRGQKGIGRLSRVIRSPRSH
jgi:hypothetical protein